MCGGLGILNLELQNECLLSKWLFKLINEDSVWQELMKKYLKDKTIGQAYWKPGYSHFWFGLMKIKDLVLHIGTSTRFWEHNWLGDYTLKQQFPSLYDIRHVLQHYFSSTFQRTNSIFLYQHFSISISINQISAKRIARKKHVTLCQVFCSAPLNISFHRALVGNKLTKWNELVQKLHLYYSSCFWFKTTT